MYAIIDHRIPEKAKRKLQDFFTLINLDGSGLCFEAISSHPDIYLFQNDEHLIVAPNAPTSLVQQLKNFDIPFVFGKKPVGMQHPESALYNAIRSGNKLIHNLKISDDSLLQHQELEHIHVKQAYTRCSVLALGDHVFLSSDRGIVKTLKRKGLDATFVSSKDVLLPGLAYGLFGGCGTVYHSKLFLIGSLKYFADASIVLEKLNQQNIALIELYDGPLYDGGGIFIVP